MYDPNVFVILTANDQKNKASSAFNLPQNSKWLHKAVGGIANEPTIDSREATPAEEPDSEDEGPSAVDRLVVTFDELIKDLTGGLQFGTNPSSSHILLGHRGTQGISAKQYIITMDDDLCIWLRDYHSTHGTAVTIKGQTQREVRRRETWMLADAPGTRNRFGEITIHSGGLAIRAHFPNHAMAEPRYIDNLRAFVKKCKMAAEKSKAKVPVVDGLGLNSDPTTATPSEAQTPSERLVYYNDKRLGKGGFGKVHRVIKARDGKFFAAKTFNTPAKKRKMDEVDPAWLTSIRREFDIMANNPHVSAQWTIPPQPRC